MADGLPYSEKTRVSDNTKVLFYPKLAPHYVSEFSGYFGFDPNGDFLNNGLHFTT